MESFPNDQKSPQIRYLSTVFQRKMAHGGQTARPSLGVPPPRDHWGRCVPGNAAGPGRPRQLHHPAYKNVVEAGIGREDGPKLSNSYLQTTQ